MESTFWHERWALKQIAFHQNEIHPFLRAFWPEVRAASPDSAVFVPLCGKTRDIWWLLESGYRVVGVELSRMAVKAQSAMRLLAISTSSHRKTLMPLPFSPLPPAVPGFGICWSAPNPRGRWSSASCV